MSTNQDHLRETTKHIILCDKCGTRYIVIPPSREYSSPMDYPCPRIDYQKSYYDGRNAVTEIFSTGTENIVKIGFFIPRKDSFVISWLDGNFSRLVPCLLRRYYIVNVKLPVVRRGTLHALYSQSSYTTEYCIFHDCTSDFLKLFALCDESRWYLQIAFVEDHHRSNGMMKIKRSKKD